MYEGTQRWAIFKIVLQDPERYTRHVKNQYFGDVNDYRKYGLLRCLVQSSKLSLGICWLLTPSDARTDGEFRRYLQEPRKWRTYDPDLYDRLQQLRQPLTQRDIAHADTWELLPGATYFNGMLGDDSATRSVYFADALTALKHCSMLFFDPDNGLEVPSKPVGRKSSSKYVYWREIEMAYSCGHSLVVYQHYPMHVKRVPFIERIAAECVRRLGAPLVDTFSTPYVVFFLIARPEHAEAFSEVHAAIAGKWPNQITPRAHVGVGPPQEKGFDDV